ncbi:MAG: SLC13 family permease [Chloroflexi bacterium]|nr:MAG: SLC13 family permease [Chloroflexota bacterium]
MTTDVVLVLLILGVSIVLFATERLRVDLVAMLVLIALLLTGILTTDEAFSGFSNPAVITVWAIYIVSASLTHTGIADYLGKYIGRFAGTEEVRMIFVVMVTVAVMSAFMNNIGATAVLLPVVIRLATKANIPVSKLLIPLAFGSLLGGVTTLIGTPPNLLASTELAEMGFEPFSLFDFTPMGLIILVSSILYMVLVGRHLLPSYPNMTHAHQDEDIDLTTEYRLTNYLAELYVQSSSPLIGKTLFDTQLGEVYDLDVMGVLRNGRILLGVMPNYHIETGDVLLTRGVPDSLLAARKEIGVKMIPDHLLTDDSLRTSEATIAEIVISQKARLIGQTLKQADFRARYGLTVLAIWREEAPIRGRLADEPLRLGDTLLVQGHRERIEALELDPAFLLLKTNREPATPRLNKAPINLLIFVSMITLVGFGVLHISIAAVMGAMLSVLTGCLNMDEAYKSIEWKSVFLIAGMLPMGVAMEKTGTAQFLSEYILQIVGSLGPLAVMIGLFVLTTVLTAFMSNAAAAVLVTPIAVQTAVSLGADPRAFVMGIAIAASNSFVTPIGHQSCVLVYGPGGYRFFDFAKVGLPLTILIWVLMLIFLPIFFPLGV